MRRRVNSEGVDELSRSFADYYRKRYADLTVASGLEVDNPADGDRLAITEHYLLKDPWTSKLGQVRQVELYADALAGDATLPDTVERTAPLALAHPAQIRHETTLVGILSARTPDMAIFFSSVSTSSGVDGWKWVIRM